MINLLNRLFHVKCLHTQGVEDLQWKGFSDLRVCLNEISHFQDVKQQRPADW